MQPLKVGWVGDGPYSSLLCALDTEKQRLWGDPVGAFLSSEGAQKKRESGFLIGKIVRGQGGMALN